MGSAKKVPPGRPARLTDEAKETVLRAFALGLPPELAAPLAGLSVVELERLYRNDAGFQRDSAAARSRAAATLLGRVSAAAANGDWKAAAWLLERLYPASFGRGRDAAPRPSRFTLRLDSMKPISATVEPEPEP